MRYMPKKESFVDVLSNEVRSNMHLLCRKTEVVLVGECPQTRMV